MSCGRIGRAKRGALLLLIGGSLCCVLVQAGSAHAADESRVYQTVHRTAQELLPVAQAALGEEGSAVADSGSLLLLGPEPAVDRALEVLSRRDVPLRMLTLTVEAASLNALRSASFGVRWAAQLGSLRTGMLEEAARVAQDHRVASRSYSTSRDQRSAYTIRVSDGGVARIALGRIQDRPRRGLLWSSSTILEATSGLVAKPQILGSGHVALTLDWSESRILPGGEVVSTQLDTTLRIEPGQALVLGSASQRSPERATRRFASSPANRQTDQVLLLRVFVDGAQ